MIKRCRRSAMSQQAGNGLLNTTAHAPPRFMTKSRITVSVDSARAGTTATGERESIRPSRTGPSWALTLEVCMIARCRLIVISLLAVLGLLIPAAPAAAASDRLPDFAMARLRGFNLERTTDGRRLLRFSAIIVNIGSGPFQLTARRADTSTTTWAAEQVIFDDLGGTRSVSIPAQFVYSGDGHNHWHFKDLQNYELDRLDNGVLVGTGHKSGFCLPGAPSSAVYAKGGCGTQASLSLTMGLSVGWGDLYAWRLPDQYIDITGLTAGRYRLWATADNGDRFVESNNANNTTRADLEITGTGVKVLRRAPNP